MSFRDQFSCFEFANSEFCVCKLDILSFVTRNFGFRNSKFLKYRFDRRITGKEKRGSEKRLFCTCPLHGLPCLKEELKRRRSIVHNKLRNW